MYTYRFSVKTLSLLAYELTSLHAYQTLMTSRSVSVLSRKFVSSMFSTQVSLFYIHDEYATLTLSSSFIMNKLIYNPTSKTVTVPIYGTIVAPINDALAAALLPVVSKYPECESGLFSVMITDQMRAAINAQISNCAINPPVVVDILDVPLSERIKATKLAQNARSSALAKAKVVKKVVKKNKKKIKTKTQKERCVKG